jgi:hypothetical protein
MDDLMDLDESTLGVDVVAGAITDKFPDAGMSSEEEAVATTKASSLGVRDPDLGEVFPDPGSEDDDKKKLVNSVHEPLVGVTDFPALDDSEQEQMIDLADGSDFPDPGSDIEDDIELLARKTTAPPFSPFPDAGDDSEDVFPNTGKEHTRLPLFPMSRIRMECMKGAMRMWATMKMRMVLHRSPGVRHR